MTDDFITRLERQLRAAEGRELTRRRTVPRLAGLRRALPGAVAVAVAGVALVALVLALPGGPNDETPAGRTDDALRVTYRVEGGDPATTAEIMRARLAAAGVDEADVSVSSDGALTIAASPSVRADVTALTEPGRLTIQDWERSVLGSPEDPDTKAEARERAAGRGRIVRDEGAANRWFALRGEPALTNADVARAYAAVDPSAQEPVVVLEFTPRGQAAFETLTRTIAQRGKARSDEGVDHMRALQHLVLVLDDRIMARPYIDFRASPDGIDGADGAQIQGGLTPESARRIAAILNSGPLPGALRADAAGSDG